MKKSIKQLLNKIELGKEQSFKNMTVIPMTYSNGYKLDYISLDTGIKNDLIEIEEISEDGSVSNLIATNKSDKRILMLDGEELIGAKQNRIINTTILLEKQTITKIPVSCVERGRWNRTSQKFRSSGSRSPKGMKAMMSKSVSDSLEKSKGKSAKSNQRAIWSNVAFMRTKLDVESKTDAMSDIFDGRKTDIEDYLMSFSKSDSQNGILVFINEKVVGLEFISRPNIFRELFPKTIRGFAMDALLNNKKADKVNYTDESTNYLVSLFLATAASYKSPGLGFDIRLDADTFLGSALEVEEEVVHLTTMDKNDKKEKKSKQSYDRPAFLRRMMD